MNAPITAILAMDLSFFEDLPRNFPAMDVSFLFKDNADFTYQTAFRNSSIQGGYFIKAAHALDLGTGPMSGFDNNGLDEEFFSDLNWKSNFLCNLGYGDEDQTRPRASRYEFDEIVKIL
jgi:3-hydroxypropanoate dehydrogenase